jgi:hypothetical protein
MESGRNCTRKFVMPSIVAKSDQINQCSSSSDDEMDYSVLYAKV